MARRTDIIAYARTLVGTPFQHQGRLPGVGLDCVGLLVAVARRFELTFHDHTGYSKYPDAQSFLRELSSGLIPIDAKEALPGDVLTFWVRHPSKPQHAALASDRGMIHAYHSFRPVGVVEEPVSRFWRVRATQCFRFPGLYEETHPDTFRIDWHGGKE
jgi:cell wall-associated NlpC family hydrolase